MIFFCAALSTWGAVWVGRNPWWDWILVSPGTSSPELFVSGGAVVQGLGNMTVGNVVGSNIVKIAIVLGIAL